MSANKDYAEALGNMVADALNNMHAEDGAATAKLLKNVEAGRAKLLIVSELIPDFKVRFMYVGSEGSSEVYTLTEEMH